MRRSSSCPALRRPILTEAVGVALTAGWTAVRMFDGAGKVARREYAWRCIDASTAIAAILRKHFEPDGADMVVVERCLSCGNPSRNPRAAADGASGAPMPAGTPAVALPSGRPSQTERT